jgi:hypothetical protein
MSTIRRESSVRGREAGGGGGKGVEEEDEEDKIK